MLCKLNATIQCNEKSIFISLLSDQIASFLLSPVETYLTLKSFEESATLRDVLVGLWSSHANEVGLLFSAVPMHIFWKRNKPVPAEAQQPLFQESKKKKGIVLIIEPSVLIFTSSLCDTSILSVRRDI